MSCPSRSRSCLRRSSGSRAQTVGGIAAGPCGAVRGGGERCVGRCRNVIPPEVWARCCPAPRGQLKQPGDVDGNPRQWARTTCRLRWGLSGRSRSGCGRGCTAAGGGTWRWRGGLVRSMGLEVVHHHHVAGAEAGGEDVRDERPERRLVQRPRKRHGAADAVEPQGRDHRGRLPRPGALPFGRAPSRGPGPRRRHRGLHAGLVQEDQPPRVEPSGLAAEPPASGLRLRPVAFRGVQALLLLRPSRPPQRPPDRDESAVEAAPLLELLQSRVGMLTDEVEQPDATSTVSLSPVPPP